MAGTVLLSLVLFTFSFIYCIQQEPTCCLGKDMSGVAENHCLDQRECGELGVEKGINHWTSVANHNGTGNTKPQDFLLLTVATEESDGYKRFIRSTSLYNVPTKVLGVGQPWKGGNMKSVGGGFKLLEFKKALQPFIQNKKMIVMLTDSYDVVLLGTVDALLEKFRAMDARVVFSAETGCWPEETLADKYPVTKSRYKYLNSGGVIGYVNDIYELMSIMEIKYEDDDQLYFTKLFLDEDLRRKHQMKLDYNCDIFQNLYGADRDVVMLDDTLVNKVHNTKPMVLHGNGPSKIALNRLTDYLPRAWTKNEGCISCRENNIDLNNVEYHEKDVLRFIDNVEAQKVYQGVKLVQRKDGITEAAAKTFAREHCLAKDCDYLLVLDSTARLDNPNTLKDLISFNRRFVAPMLVRPGTAWSNFWGERYARSFDYMDIVNNEKRGVWNMPHISAAYLMNATLLRLKKPLYKSSGLDLDTVFNYYYNQAGVFMYVSNVRDYGHLVNPVFYNPSLLHPEMYELLSNRLEWQRRYISREYMENKTPEQPCPDVYWFPVTTTEFAQNLIDIMENYGMWSNSFHELHQDPSIEAGYKNIPSRAIHMKQVGLHDTWSYFLEKYVDPLIKRFYSHVDRIKDGECRFNHNCSMDARVGWMMMHPCRSPSSILNDPLRVTSNLNFTNIVFHKNKLDIVLSLQSFANENVNL